VHAAIDSYEGRAIGARKITSLACLGAFLEEVQTYSEPVQN